jgi:predicted aconitase
MDDKDKLLFHSRDIGNLLKNFIDLNQIDDVSEIQTIEEFLVNVETQDKRLLVIFIGRDIVSLLDELSDTERLTTSEKQRVRDFIRIYRKIISYTEVYETRKI